MFVCVCVCIRVRACACVCVKRMRGVKFSVDKKNDNT